MAAQIKKVLRKVATDDLVALVNEFHPSYRSHNVSRTELINRLLLTQRGGTKGTKRELDADQPMSDATEKSDRKRIYLSTKRRVCDEEDELCRAFKKTKLVQACPIGGTEEEIEAYFRNKSIDKLERMLCYVKAGQTLLINFRDKSVGLGRNQGKIKENVFVGLR